MSDHTRPVGVLIERNVVALAHIAVELDRTVTQLDANGAELTETDGFLMAPVRRHIERAVDRLDNLLWELDHYGRGYPEGQPRLRLAGEPVETHQRPMAAAA